MSRRVARKCAVQFLYRVDFVKYEDASALNADLQEFWQSNCEAQEGAVTDFAFRLISGTLKHLESIDTAIITSIQKWRFDRLAVMDKTILRCATYELLYCDDIPSSVSINEALELAKQFSTSQSVAFINGILDSIAKKHGYKK